MWCAHRKESEDTRTRRTKKEGWKLKRSTFNGRWKRDHVAVLDAHHHLLASRCEAFWLLLWLESPLHLHSWRSKCLFSELLPEIHSSLSLTYVEETRRGAIIASFISHFPMEITHKVMRKRACHNWNLWIWPAERWSDTPCPYPYFGTVDPNVREVPLLVLSSWSCYRDYTLIYYYRHQSSTLRFYSLHGLKLDATNRPNIDEGSAYAAAAKHDFTLPRKWETTASLNDVVITQVKCVAVFIVRSTHQPQYQFNSAKTLENIIDHIEPRKPLLFATSVKSLGASLLPAIATLSHFLTTVCNIPFVLSSSPRLRDLSATSTLPYDVYVSQANNNHIVQQIDVRAEQGDFFVNEIGTLRPRSSAAIPLYSARYTKLVIFLFCWSLVSLTSVPQLLQHCLVNSKWYHYRLRFWNVSLWKSHPVITHDDPDSWSIAVPSRSLYVCLIDIFLECAN